CACYCGNPLIRRWFRSSQVHATLFSGAEFWGFGLDSHTVCLYTIDTGSTIPTSHHSIVGPTRRTVCQGIQRARTDGRARLPAGKEPGGVPGRGHVYAVPGCGLSSFLEGWFRRDLPLRCLGRAAGARWL